jgi:hypothetical protein
VAPRVVVLLVKRTNGVIETYACIGEPSLELAGRYSPTLGKITCLEPITDDWLSITQVHPSSPFVTTVERAYRFYLIENGGAEEAEASA